MTKKVFRAWDEEDKRMIRFGLFELDCGLHIDSMKSVDEMPIMQFTGAKDKNGTEIFEGDIIKEKNGLIFSLKIDGYIPSKACIELDEVIGNVYENPELIK